MENNKEGRPRRQRISSGDRKVYSSNNFSNGERRSFNGGERRSYNGGERKSYSSSNGARKPYGSSSSNSEHRSFNDGERRSFNGGERRPYSSNGERRPYGSSSSNSEHRSFNGGERRSFNDGERRSFNRGNSSNGERRSFNGGERRNFNGGNRPMGDRRPFNRKPFVKREENEEGINRMIEQRNQQYISEFSDNDVVEVPVKEVIRLNKYIANSGICSRREADNYIQAGVVTVNGEVVTELGSKVNIYTDDIRFNGERLHGENKVYIVMNKPKGYVTTASDPHADKTVMDLLKGCEARVFAVGRLDKNTTGVLMFTNDGEMAEKLTHPSYDKKKIYQVSLDADLKKEDYEKILAGITLSDGEVSADDLQYVDDNDHRKIGIEIHSGKNRIVRRIFESLGYDVKALDRVYFAGLTKKGLKRGEWRYLTEGETNILKIGSYK